MAVDDDGPGTFGAQIDQRESVLSVWTVEEWDDEQSAWNTVAAGVDSVPFALDDGTGEVLVEVGSYVDSRGPVNTVANPKASDGVSFGDVLVEIDGYRAVEEVGAEEPTPEHVRRFVDRHSALDAQSGSVTNVVDVGNAHGDRRYHETAFAEGEELYVLGRACPRDGDRTSAFRPEELVVTAPRGDDDGMLIVANESERDLVAQTRYHLLGLVLGGASLVGGMALLVMGI